MRNITSSVIKISKKSFSHLRKTARQKWHFIALLILLAERPANEIAAFFFWHNRKTL